MLDRKALFVAGMAVGTTGWLVHPLLAGQVKGNRPPVSSELNDATLKQTLVRVGYKPKTLESGGYEVETKSGDLTVFMVVNLSKSGQKLWFTVNLGDMTETDKKDAARLYQMLQRNMLIQPAQFFINTKHNLRLGAPLDNRGLTSAMIKKQVDQLATYVADSKDLWKHVPDPPAGQESPSGLN